MSEEEWRAVLGGRYAVSDRGRVKSLPHTDRLGRQWRGKVLSPSVDVWGYLAFVSRLEKRALTYRVHVLVAGAFHGAKPKRAEVNHKDGNKLRNCASNLEYKTRKGNAEHASKLGLMPTKANGRWRRKWRP